MDQSFSYSVFVCLERSLTERITQIVPTASNGVDAVNFRHLQESTSLHLEKGEIMGVAGAGNPLVNSGLTTPGVDDGLDPLDAALFESFSNVTLHYDGE